MRKTLTSAVRAGVAWPWPPIPNKAACPVSSLCTECRMEGLWWAEGLLEEITQEPALELPQVALLMSAVRAWYSLWYKRPDHKSWEVATRACFLLTLLGCVAISNQPEACWGVRHEGSRSRAGCWNYLCVKIRDDDDAGNYSISVGRTIGQSLQEEAQLSVGVSSSRGKCDASGVRNASTNKRWDGTCTKRMGEDRDMSTAVLCTQ